MRCTILLIALVVPQALGAQADRLTPRDVFEFEFPHDPQISPDGQWVAWERRSSDVMTDRRYSTIWLVKSDGTEQRPLTSGKVNDATPRWSPDGTRLAWLSTTPGGTPQIVVRWMASGQIQAITNVAEPPLAFAWSPDGKQIAFMKLAPESPLVIGTPGTPPPGASWAPPPKYTDKLMFRFDGQGELPSGFVHLFVVPSDGGTARQLTSGSFHDTGSFGSLDIAWAPDGNALVIASRRRADWETSMIESDLFEVSLTAGGMKQLTDRFGPDATPAVSPDGKLIAYTGFDDRKQGYQNTLLYVMNRDGTGKRALSAKLDQSVGDPVWSADSRGVYVSWSQHGNTKLGLIALDGTVRNVAADLGAGGSAYGNGSFSVARDGSVAWTYTRPDLPGEVAVFRPTQPMRVVTSVNADLLATRELGKVDSLWWESSKDKRKIQGWVITPPNFDPNRKYPLILEIHGGPFADYGDRFDIEKQLMAAAGYVVLYTNPRGSTSYGEEFGNLIHHAYPGDDFHDLNSGVDAVIAKGFIDEKRLYVTGGSGGGVLTAWMIGNTDRFRAALAFYPVINWESFVLTADMSALGVNNWFPGMPWDQQANYTKRSLLSVVKNVKTPTLIMTGEEDYRTPMSESEQYYKALKLLGVETVLVRVPGEPHGIRVRPSHFMSKVTTLEGWFEKFRPAVP